MIVYLSGGMHSNWRDKIRNTNGLSSSVVDYIDPTEHGLDEPRLYT